MRWLLPPLACLPLLAHAASQDFALVNRTGFAIERIYVSEAGRQRWGSSVLGRDTLGDDETVTVGFPREERVCRWDLRVVYRDHAEAVWSGVNLCGISRIVLFWDKRTRLTTARVE